MFDGNTLLFLLMTNELLGGLFLSQGRNTQKKRIGSMKEFPEATARKMNSTVESIFSFSDAVFSRDEVKLYTETGAIVTISDKMCSDDMSLKRFAC